MRQTTERQPAGMKTICTNPYLLFSGLTLTPSTNPYLLFSGLTLTPSSRFVYDGWNLIQESTASATDNYQLSTKNLYVWGLDMSGSIQGAGGVGGLLAVAQKGSTYYPAYDGNGNIMEYVSGNGDIVAHYEYSPFGETVVQSGTLADAFAFRFSSKYFETRPVRGKPKNRK